MKEFNNMISMLNDKNDIILEQQKRIDDLQKKYDAMYNAFVCADDCRKEWHECFIRSKGREDELQKRIDKALQMISDWNDQTYRDDSTQLIGEMGDILKYGEQQ